MHSQLTSPLAKADSACSISATEGRSSAIKRKNRPSDDGRETRVLAYGEDTLACRLRASSTRSARGMRTQVLPDGQNTGSKPRFADKKQKGHQLVSFCFVKRLRKRYFSGTSIRIRTQGKLFKKLFIFSFAF